MEYLKTFSDEEIYSQLYNAIRGELTEQVKNEALGFAKVFAKGKKVEKDFPITILCAGFLLGLNAGVRSQKIITE